ncbi:unnamed protein product [Clonostachys rosea f. rosea IK726]|uniref:Uncharacterized protein n=1 Tax=Clonostachys rosea f. rosea IK726 TaxID=1349383 RepID=A0ACA9U9Q1_BIOOC|nr:unnamed protein product [Clonostachys rosea f. rosea IK726]
MGRSTSSALTTHPMDGTFFSTLSPADQETASLYVLEPGVISPWQIGQLRRPEGTETVEQMLRTHVLGPPPVYATESNFGDIGVVFITNVSGSYPDTEMPSERQRPRLVTNIIASWVDLGTQICADALTVLPINGQTFHRVEGWAILRVASPEALSSVIAANGSVAHAWAISHVRQRLLKEFHVRQAMILVVTIAPESNNEVILARMKESTSVCCASTKFTGSCFTKRISNPTTFGLRAPSLSDAMLPLKMKPVIQSSSGTGTVSTTCDLIICFRAMSSLSSLNTRISWKLWRSSDQETNRKGRAVVISK